MVRRWDQFEFELGGLRYELDEVVVTPATVAVAVAVPQPSITGTNIGITSETVTVAITPAILTPVLVSGVVPATVPIVPVVHAPLPISSVIQFATESTLFPDRVGATAGSSLSNGGAPDTSAHTVVAGATSRTAGAAPILTGDYAFRGLYAFNTTLTVPLNYPNHGRDWATLASWGDFQLRIRREAGAAYTVRADFITAGLVATYFSSSILIEYDEWFSLGLGVTRDSATGEIKLWRSDDDWGTWTELPRASYSFSAGALPDSVPDSIVLLGGDLSEGPWVSVLQAQWGATDDITAVDAEEVAAWNYGANIVTGLGGDFYDDIDRAVKNLWEFGGNSSYVYKQRSETTDAGTTVRADFTINAPTIYTSDPPAGTAAAFAYDHSPIWENGPAPTQACPPILFSAQSQFTVNRAPPPIYIPPALTFPAAYSSGSGTLPIVGAAITWAGGGVGTVGSLDSGNNVAGSLTIIYTSGPHPTYGVALTSGGWTSIAEDVTTRGYDGTPLRYRVLLVLMDGTPGIALDNAVVGDITWSLNEAETFSFTLPNLDPLAAEITVANQEVQIWRGDYLMVWGVVVRSATSGATIEYQCKGLAWYFTKRFIGSARHNYLENGSFESSGYWFHELYAPTEDPANRLPANWSSEISSERSVNGYPGRSLKLTSNDAIDFGISSAQFIFSEIDNFFWPDGMKWTAAAWIYIPSADWGYYDTETEKIIGERNAAYNWGGESAPFGLHLGRFSSTEWEDAEAIEVAVGGPFPKVYEIAVAGITEDLPRDQWVRIETSLTQPPVEAGIFGSRTDWIQVELHCPQGTVFWDEVSLTRNDRLFYNDVDQEAILFGLVEHAQDPAYGKSDLNIGFAAAPITNVTRTRTYDFFNHRLISDAIDEFSTLWQGCDWSIETTATQRLFSPWFPMKGTRRPAQALVLGRNIASISVAEDGEQVANRVIVMSDGGGTGSSREEAIGTNTEGFAFDLVLETTINAIPESPLDSLEGQMQRTLRQKRNATIPTVTTYAGRGSELLGQISTGDIVPVEASYGGLIVSGDHRIVSMTYQPDTETMAITVNPFTEYQDPLL